MAPVQSRQLLVWSLPSLAILLSYLWFRKKRQSGVQSDPGEPKVVIKQSKSDIKLSDSNAEVEIKTELQDTTPKKNNHTLLGVETPPIDIIIPYNLKASKTPPVVISDEDLDIEIEKLKSMKSPIVEPSCKRKIRSSLSLELQKSKAASFSEESKNKDVFEMSPKSKSVKKNQSSLKTTPKLKSSPKISKKNEEKQAPKMNDELQKKEETEVTLVADKLSHISLETTKSTIEAEQSAESDETNRQSSERDSANHSPVDVMLASPSLSSISDNHSEGSSDSGKGCSDVATPAGDGSLSGDAPHQSGVYEFVLPQTLVGRLIGRHGVFATDIKSKTNAKILIKKHPDNQKLKICAIEGLQSEIDSALKMIRQKFPEKRYPNVTLEQVTFAQTIPTCTLIPECIYVKLIEGVNNDTIISHVEDPTHIFVQQHTHPSYPHLNRLVDCMTAVYSAPDSPLLPKPIQERSICAAPLNDIWYRASVLSTNEETDTSFIQFMDFGGYSYVENNCLRQIRADFMTLPFQAAECLLANVRLRDDIDVEDCRQFVNTLMSGCLLQTQIVSYTAEAVPIVFIYVVLGPGNILFLNREIVEQGIADWEDEFPVTV